MMKQQWFKSAGWLHIPIHPMGWLVSMAAILFMVPVVLAVIRNGHSISDDLYQLFVYGTCTAFWWEWVAARTSGKGIKNSENEKG